MSNQITYRKFSQIVLDAHYDGFGLPEAPISERFIAERSAMKVAKWAALSAFANSKEGNVTYSNDQFISVFYNCPLLTNATTGDKYSVLPATPAGLPNGREIEQISFTGSPNTQVIPCQNRMAFVERFLPPLPQDIVLYKIEDGNVVFMDLPSIITSNVNMKLIGAVPPGTTILDSAMNVPKDVQDGIFLELLNELTLEYRVEPKNLNIGEPTT